MEVPYISMAPLEHKMGQRTRDEEMPVRGIFTLLVCAKKNSKTKGTNKPAFFFFLSLLTSNMLLPDNIIRYENSLVVHVSGLQIRDLFKVPTTTRMTNIIVVNQIASFTIVLQSSLLRVQVSLCT